MLKPGTKIRVGNKYAVQFFYNKAVGKTFYIAHVGRNYGFDVYYIREKPDGPNDWWIHIDDAILIEGKNEDMLHLLYREEDI